MTDTWRFIIIVALLVAFGTLLPFAVTEAAHAAAWDQDLRAHTP